MDAEQATALSDGILALEAIGLAGALWFRRATAAAAAAPMAGFLAAAGLAAALGGAWHAGHEVMPPSAELWLWRVTLATVGVANACLLTALVRAKALRRHARSARGVILAKFAAYLVIIAFTNSFFPAVVDQVLTLIGGLGVVVWDATHERSLPHGWLTAGILLAVTGGGIQASGLGLGQILNHNVLYHVIAMVALAAFWFAARTWDRPTLSAP